MSFTVIAIASSVLATTAVAQTSLNYGRVTAVRPVQVEDPTARAAGTIIGGTLGVLSGKGKSDSNKALRGIGGAALGSSLSGTRSRAPAFEYTVLLDGTSTIRVVADTAGIRTGDCVAIERGAFNNLRLVPEERCAHSSAKPAAEIAEADACVQAKQMLLDAKTDSDFDRAERRMRALCN